MGTRLQRSSTVIRNMHAGSSRMARSTSGQLVPGCVKRVVPLSQLLAGIRIPGILNERRVGFIKMKMPQQGFRF